MKIIKILIVSTVLMLQLNASTPSAKKAASFELWEQIAQSISGQNVSQSIVKNIVTYSPDNKFSVGELVVIKRSSGEHVLAFVNSKLEKLSSGLEVYSTDLGKGQVKKVPVKEIGKIIEEPGLHKWLPEA